RPEGIQANAGPRFAVCHSQDGLSGRIILGSGIVQPLDGFLPIDGDLSVAIQIKHGELKLGRRVSRVRQALEDLPRTRNVPFAVTTQKQLETLVKLLV